MLLNMFSSNKNNYPNPTTFFLIVLVLLPKTLRLQIPTLSEWCHGIQTIFASSDIMQFFKIGRCEDISVTGIIISSNLDLTYSLVDCLNKMTAMATLLLKRILVQQCSKSRVILLYFLKIFLLCIQSPACMNTCMSEGTSSH